MANVPDAYSGISDLLIGDIPLSDRHGDGSAMIKATAEEIDASLGHIYVTPMTVDPDPKYRPTVLLLKKINNFLASGRLLMDMAAASEDHETQGYARWLMKEAGTLLQMIIDGKIALTGVTRIEVDGSVTEGNKVVILNEDEYSLVEGFYRRGNGEVLIGDMGPYSSDSTYF